MRMKLFFAAIVIMLSIGTFVSCGNKKKTEDTTAQTEQVEEKCCQANKDEACADKTKECCEANPECESAKKEACCETAQAEKKDCCKAVKSE